MDNWHGLYLNSELKKAYVVYELKSYVGVFTLSTSGFPAEKYMVELMPEPSPGKKT